MERGIDELRWDASLFYNFLSDEERRLFTTKPKEVTAWILEEATVLKVCRK